MTNIDLVPGLKPLLAAICFVAAQPSPINTINYYNDMLATTQVAVWDREGDPNDAASEAPRLAS